jgi:hypothetical protein
MCPTPCQREIDCSSFDFYPSYLRASRPAIPSDDCITVRHPQSLSFKISRHLLRSARPNGTFQASVSPLENFPKLCEPRETRFDFAHGLAIGIMGALESPKNSNISVAQVHKLLEAWLHYSILT